MRRVSHFFSFIWRKIEKWSTKDLTIGLLQGNIKGIKTSHFQNPVLLNDRQSDYYNPLAHEC